MANLNGRIAVITGASSGIGARTAIRLANANITVVGLARRTTLIEDLNKQVNGGGHIYAHQCDLSNEVQLLAAFEWIEKQFNTIDILICNAGILKANFLIESSVHELKEVYDLNIYATTLCLRQTLRIMRCHLKAKGHIIIMNSVLGHYIPLVAMPMFSVYPASKHAITALCQTIRQEIAHFKLNIKLTSISPDLVKTDLLNVYSNKVNELPQLNADDVVEAIVYALETPDHVQVNDISLQAINN